MPAGDLNDGSRFGLVPIGLPQANLGTSASDTERRQFPGLATRGSVFAWTLPFPVLTQESVINARATQTVNLRNNTAPSGVSVDVPTWAAGCFLQYEYGQTAIGTSTYTQHFIYSTSQGVINQILMEHVIRAATGAGGSEITQVIVPFFDEPTFAYGIATDGTGTFYYLIRLMGFIRNV